MTFAQESTYGSIPTGVYSWFGLVNEAEPTVNVGNIQIRKLGLRDLASIVKGRREAEVRFEYFMQPSGSVTATPAGSSFLRNNNLFGDMTGSFTTEMFYSRTTNPLVMYVSGCKIESCSIDTRIGEATRVTVNAWGQQFVTGSVVSGSSVQSDPATAPFMWYDGAVDYTPSGGSIRRLNNVTEIRTTVRNNLERVYNVQNNTTTIRVLPERAREIDGELTINFESFDQLTELLNDTDFRLDVGYGSPSSTLTTGITGSFYNCKWNSTSYPTRPTELIAYRLPFVPRSGSIT